MTDAESFYLVLAGFYLFECLKLQPTQRNAFSTLGTGKGHWAPKRELSRFLGIRKWAFLAPLLPWPGAMFIVPRRQPNPRSPSPLRTRRLIRIYFARASRLRILSMGIFLYYFAALPYLYFHLKGEALFLGAVAFGYALMIWAALLLFRAYRALKCGKSEGLAPQLIYTCFLPWHAMRCADELAFAYSRAWNVPSVLGALSDSPKCRNSLERLYRDSLFRPSALYTSEALTPALEFSKIDPARAVAAPSGIGRARYCPCCQATYEPGIERCSDCRDVPLISFR